MEGANCCFCKLEIDKEFVLKIQKYLDKNKTRYAYIADIGAFFVNDFIIFSCGRFYCRGYLSAKYSLEEIITILPQMISNEKVQFLKPRYFLSTYELVN